MSEMIEKIARAIWRERWIEPEPEVLPPEKLGPAQSDWERCKEVYFRDARAALTALEEPTEAMLEAAWSKAFDGGWELSLPQCERVFSTMIAAAKGGEDG